MKKLLDRFLRRPSAEPATPAPTPEPPKEKAREKAPQPLAKIAVPARTVRPAWSASTGAKRKALPERSAPAEMLTLTLGDFADRIPSDLLGMSTPDLSTPVPFDLAGLSERIGRGDAGIPAVELAQRMPGMFRENAVIAPDRVIFFPWKKIHSLIAQARDGTTAPGLTPAGAETLSLKVRARKIRRPSGLAPGRKEPAAKGGAAPQKPAEASATPAVEIRTLPAPAAVPEAGSPPPPQATQIATPVPDSASFQPEQQQQLGALTEERDAAVGALAPLREELVALREQSATASREFSTLLDKLALLEKQQAESAAANAALIVERDAALARALAPASPAPAAEDHAARIATLVAERDAALAQTAQAVADNEAALALATEQTAERDAALARQKELAAERDAAAARAATLATEHDAARSRAAELGGEMAASVSRAAELARELEAALARNTELTKERDAASARVADLEAARLSTPAAVPATGGADSQIEGYRNTIQSLYAERDTLRAEQQQLIVRLAAAGVIVDKKTLDATGETNPTGDAYVTLFPKRSSNTSPLVVALLMVLLAYGIYAASKTDLTRTAASLPAHTAAPERRPAPVATTSEISHEIATKPSATETELVPVAAVQHAPATESAQPTSDPNDALPGEGPVD